MGYKIHVNGSLLFSSDADDESYIALDPKLTLDINAAGSLSFTIPPGNVKHGSLQKLKSIVTVEQDGERLFRGRVMEDERDLYNQRNVYCEGELSFLLDSLYEADIFNGGAQELFRKIIENHNSQVDASKRFTVGTITAADTQDTTNTDVRVETRKFWDTSTVIKDRLLNTHGGYLRTRTVGTTRYIDWVKKYGSTNSQPIEFAVNLLDLKEKVSAEDVFTVLIPLGWSEIQNDGSYSAPVNIASVNGGVEYIQDDAAVALYGKIWRTKTWGATKDPSELLTKAREHLKTGVEFQTLTLKAVDMHFVDPAVDSIRLGDKVRIVSNPHGIDLTMVCSKIVIDLLNPQNTEYTFGEKPRTLTESVASTQNDVGNLTGHGGGGSRKSVEDEVAEILRWAKVQVSEVNAQILLTAGEINNLEGRTTSAELAINGLNAEIALKTRQVAELGERVTEAEASLTVQAEQITSKVSKDGVISSINQTAEAIKIQASKINLSGYVTASQFSAEIVNINNQWSSKVSTAELEVASLFTFQNFAIGRRSKSVITGLPAFTTATVTLANGNQIKVVTGWADTATKETLFYLGDAF